jgi:hypothetical protein
MERRTPQRSDLSSSLVAVEQNATLIAVIISSQILAASFGSACCMRRSDRSSRVQRQSDLRRQRHRDNLLLVRLCNRLIAVLYNNATITSFGYDAFGQRVYPIITTTSTDHVSVLDCFHDQELDKCTLQVGRRAKRFQRGSMQGRSSYGELGVSRLRAE